jgi:hypothetical protein
MSSLQIPPIEQASAEFLTTLAVTLGQAGNAQKILGRAQAAFVVGQGLQAIASGNLAQAATLLQSASAIANLEPGFALALNGLLSWVLVQAQAMQALAAGVPLVSSAIAAIGNNIAAGVTAAANAEITRYANQPSAAAPAA